jgi:hypothetical protein
MLRAFLISFTDRKKLDKWAGQVTADLPQDRHPRVSFVQFLYLQLSLMISLRVQKKAVFI